MIRKEDSMLLQKTMIANHYDRLSSAHDEGKKVVYTFVPGNLNELVRSFDLLPVLPDTLRRRRGPPWARSVARWKMSRVRRRT